MTKNKVAPFYLGHGVDFLEKTINHFIIFHMPSDEIRWHADSNGIILLYTSLWITLRRILRRWGSAEPGLNILSCGLANIKLNSRPKVSLRCSTWVFQLSVFAGSHSTGGRLGLCSQTKADIYCIIRIYIFQKWLKGVTDSGLTADRNFGDSHTADKLAFRCDHAPQLWYTDRNTR